MIRTTLLALAATTGLMCVPELSNSNAQAGTVIRFGVYAGYRPGYYRSAYYRPIVFPPVVVTACASAPVVYAPAPPVVVAPPPVAVAPVATQYDVLFRNSANGPWQLYASYPSYPAAQAAVPGLQSNGMWVMVEPR
jgi:hypothetical protein